METSDRIMSSGVSVIGAEAPSTYHMAPRSLSESPNPPPPPPNQFLGSSLATTPMEASAAGSGEALGMMTMKKKRGRPRKYEANNNGTTPLLSSSTTTSLPLVKKRGRAKTNNNGFDMNFHKTMAFNTSGERFGVGSNFTPHIITVNTGEDVTMRVISFSQQGPRAICILSANGVISNVTLRQPDSCGGTLTYEGRFEILSLTGSFMETEDNNNQGGGSKSRSGGMSVSLAGPDGRVVGGGVAGLLIAATPIQIVVGSFVTNDQQESHQKPRKQKVENTPSTVMTLPTPPPPPPGYSSEREHQHQPQPQPQHQQPPTSSFGISNWSNGQDNNPRNPTTDINISLPSD